MIKHFFLSFEVTTTATAATTTTTKLGEKKSLQKSLTLISH